jgi:hypothetical protein
MTVLSVNPARRAGRREYRRQCRRVPSFFCRFNGKTYKDVSVLNRFLSAYLPWYLVDIFL